MAVDAGVLIASGSAAIVALASVHQTRIGKRQEREAQTAANQLQRKAQQHDVYRDMVSDLERQVDRCQAELERLHTQCAHERAEHRLELAHLRDLIATLQGVVRSEIAKTAAEDGLDSIDTSDVALDPPDDV